MGFVTILQATWECVLLSNWPGLLNGYVLSQYSAAVKHRKLTSPSSGTAGLIWCTVAVWIFMLALIASIAEMASMAPNSGGQYHWVSEFAPASMQKSLSYAAGWASTIGWIAGVPSCATQLAGIIQQLVATGNPDTSFSEAWQTTLLMFAFTFLIVGFNIYGAHQLPMLEGVILFAHILGFFAFLLVFWIMADHAPATQTFTSFYNGGGWSSTGLSCLIGLTSPIWCFIGPDAGAHMSEELKDASIQLPKAMMWSIFLNGVLGVTMVVSFCFCITNVETFVNSVRRLLEIRGRSLANVLSGLRLPYRRRRLQRDWLIRWYLRPDRLPPDPAFLLCGFHRGKLLPTDLEFRQRSCEYHLRIAKQDYILTYVSGLPIQRVDPPDQAQLRRPGELPSRDSRGLANPCLYQLRQRHRPQRHPVRQQCGFAPILHHINRCTASSPPARRASPTAPLVAWQIWWLHQRYHPRVSGRGVLLLLLAILRAGWRSDCSGGLQLGNLGLSSGGRAVICVLLCWWQT